MSKIVIGNFKAQGNLEFFSQYFQKFSSAGFDKARVILCPSFPFLDFFGRQRTRIPFDLGSQDCSYHSESVTGDIPAAMLKGLGVSYVIINHSERSVLDALEITRKKITSALASGLKIIVCVGEDQACHTQGHTFSFLKKQLQELTQNFLEKDWAQLVLAYEPVWAVGTGKTPEVPEICKVAAYLKSLMPIKDLPVVYGGSVSLQNAKELLSQPSLDGLLVGRACLDPETFSRIISAI